MADHSKAQSGSRKGLLILSLVAIIAIAAGGFLYFNGMDSHSELSAAPSIEDPDVPMDELMAKGPLPDIEEGDPKAPVTVVEYASMTCPHCADFAVNVFPEFKKKYIDTGKVKLIFREFPLDILAARASMLARCAGPDKYMAMVSALFQTQEGWAVPGDEPASMKGLLGVARQAGMSKESFDKCMADEKLYQDIVKQRARAASEFGVNSTPSFFINGKKLGRDHQLEDFDAILQPGEHAAAGDKDGAANP